MRTSRATDQANLGNRLGFGHDYLTNVWSISVLPGIAIFIATLAMSLLGGWVRDRLNLTLKWILQHQK